MIKSMLKDINHYLGTYVFFIGFTMMVYLFKFSRVNAEGFFDVNTLFIITAYFSILYYMYQIRLFKVKFRKYDFEMNFTIFFSKVFPITFLFISNLIIFYNRFNSYYYQLNLITLTYDHGIDLLKFITVVFFVGILPTYLRIVYLLLKTNRNKVAIHPLFVVYLYLFYFLTYFLFYGLYDQLYHLKERIYIVFFFLVVYLLILFVIILLLKRRKEWRKNNEKS